MPDDVIGTAKIKVEADLEGVKNAVPEIKSELENAGSAGEAAGNKIGDAFEGAGSVIEKRTAGMRKFQGAISGAVGALTGMVGVITSVVGVVALLGRAFSDTKDRGKDFGKEINSINDAIEKFNVGNIDSFKELQRERRLDIEDQIRAAEHISSVRKAQLIQEVRDTEYVNALLYERLKVEEGVANVQATREQFAIERYEKQKQAAKELFELEKQLRLDAESDPVSRAEEEAKIRMNSLQELIRASGEADTTRARELIELEETLSQRRIDNIQKEADERARRETEAAERSAKAAADAFERAMAPLIASLTTSFGNGFTTQLGSITNKIDEAVDELRKVKRGR